MPIRPVFCALLLLLLVATTAHGQVITLAPRTTAGTGGIPVATAIADFNGDGVPDLAVVNSFDDTVSILLANVTAPGTFLANVDYDTASFPVDLAIADLDGDGNLDIVVITCSCDGPVSVLFGNGDGTFEPPANYPFAIEPYALAIADLNADGIPDLVISDDVGDENGLVWVLLGDSSAPGTFLDPVSYTVGLSPGGVRIADFNGDGIPDFAVTNFGSDDISVLLGAGDGTFAAADSYPTDIGPDALVVNDFNRDGLPDLAAATSNGTISVLLSNAVVPGTFNDAVEYSAGGEAFGLASGDLNGNGKPDLVVANLDVPGRVRVLRGRGDGTFGVPLSFGGGNTPVGPSIADLNGDGRPDIVVVNSLFADTASILLNTTPFIASLEFSSAGYSVARESAGARTITVTRTGGLGIAVTVDYATSNGTATAPGDYTAASGTLSFGAMETSKTFTVMIVNNNVTEGAETINLTLSNPGPGAVLGTASTAVLTIAANDTSRLQFSKVAYDATGASTSPRTITVRRAQTGTAVTVNYATSNGSAVAGVDYTATSGTLSFGPTETTKTFQVPFVTGLPTARTINLTLSAPTGGAVLGPRSAAVLTIGGL